MKCLMKFHELSGNFMKFHDAASIGGAPRQLRASPNPEYLNFTKFHGNYHR